MDISQVIDSSRYSMLNNLRTGNIIFDTFLSIFLVFVINQILIKTQNINIDRIKNWFMNNSNRNCITFECSKCNNFRGKTLLDSSETFKAILFYIKKSLKNDKTKNLYGLTEYYSVDYDDYYDDDDEDNNDDCTEQKREIIYFTNQYSEFEITDELSKNIFFRLKTVKNQTSEKNNRLDEGKPTCKYILSIFSYKRSLKEIQNTIDIIHKEYCDYIENKYNKNLHIFMYMGADNNQNLKFKTYPFHTTCNLDKVYFNNKDKIMNQINFFETNKQWYIDKGKPYTLGICTHGPPGCGKTSFEKALSKKLNRHLIIVDFSRIKTQNEADEIFFSETINGKKIPYDKRMYLFPDIDRMTNILNKRNISNVSQPVSIDKATEETEEKEMLKTILKEVAPTNYSLLKPKDNNIDSPLNLSKILNILDGIPERTGQIMIMSTNHPELLDDALLRPGRVDCMIEFRKASVSIVRKIIKNFYDIRSLTDGEEKVIKKFHEVYSPAELFKKCSEASNIKELMRNL